MPVKQSDYEALLAEYSNPEAAIALLKKYRPYLEKIPSMRRPTESVIAIPLPIIRIRQTKSPAHDSGGRLTAVREATCLPCDLAILMCDPEWKIKMGGEIFIFIHRPDEEFSNLLSRWRQTQVLLDKDYEWLMPPAYQHILSEGADCLYPMFVVFPETPQRLKRGLMGATLPFIEEVPQLSAGEESTQRVSAQWQSH